MSIPAYLDGQSSEGPARRGARRTLRLHVTGKIASGNQTRALVHNISAGGLLLESSASIAQGDTIEIDLPHAGATSAIVMWTSGELYGCRFVDPVSSAALSAAELRSAVGPDIDAFVGAVPAEPDEFGARLRKMRKARGLTQGELADLVGVSMPAISAWEKGKAHPRDNRMNALAGALGRPISDLLPPEAPEMLDDVLARSREQIAQIVGTTPDRIRILIEI